jgi:hypothetical protein
MNPYGNKKQWMEKSRGERVIVEDIVSLAVVDHKGIDPAVPLELKKLFMIRGLVPGVPWHVSSRRMLSAEMHLMSLPSILLAPWQYSR